VSGDEYVGGLVGYHVAPATIRRSYSTGLVTGISNVGGLVGSGTYGITDSYWNTDTSGQASSGSTSGVIGLSTLDMHSTASFAGFAFSTVPGAGGNSWVMVDADGTLNNAGGVTGATFPMLTSEYSTVISNGHQLQLMTMDLGASYTLAVHIDASGTAVAVANGNGDVWSTAGGFVPIGSSASPFTGSFNGQGRTIANLTLNRPTTDHVGLFGVVANGATIQNVGLVGGNVSGQNFVGALAGETWGTISNSYATATVTGGSDVGGLVGTNQGSVSDAYATGAVIGNSSVGGLVGTNHGLIANAYTTGTVSGDQTIGGLVGYNANDGSVSNAYATGNMSGDQNVGGLAGYNENGGTVNNAYATGNVSGNDNVGGLVGSSDGSIRSAYSTGLVTGSSNVGGLVGSSAGGVTDSYWNMDTSGQTSGGRGSAGTGLSTLQMQTVSNFSGFAFSTVPGAGGNSWVMVDADGTLNNAGGVTGATFPMLTSEYSTVIANAHQLQLTLMDLGARYTLAANIDASATAVAVTNGVGDVWSTAGGFVPIGSRVSAFTGSFDGQGRTIGNLTINRPATDYVGLFGYAADAATIQNVGLVDGSVSGKDYVGGLAGATWGTISNSYNTGSVSGYGFVGGLVGWGGYGAISNSYATGNVTGNSGVGGLMGATRGAISNSYATGNVVGSYAGGLVGVNVGSMSNSYATGSVTGSDYVGGLVGRNIASIDTSYSTGVVGGTGSEVGGLIGGNQGKVTNSFWNTTTNGDLAGVGDGDDSGITGLTSAGMMMTSNFTAVSWSISGSDGGSTWRIYAGNTAPLLSSFLTPLTVIAVDDSVVFNGGPFTGGNGVIYSATPKGNLLGTLAYGGSSQGAIAAGGYAITPGGLYSNQQGYSIAFAIGTLTINRLALTGTISTGSSVYGASLAPGSVTFTNLVSGYTAVTATDTVTIDTAGNLSGSGNLKAGSYTGIETVEGALGGTDAGNYSFAGLTGDYAVSKLALAGSIAAGSSIYGATLTPGAVSFSNAVAYDVLGTATVNVITGGQTSTGGNLTAGTHTGVEAVSALSGADAANYTFAGVTGDYAVNKLALAGSIAAGSSVYGATLAPGAASFSNAVAYDVLGTATVNVNTTGQTSSSGNLTAGTHTGVEAVSALSGADAGNYTFAGLTGDYAVNKLALAGSITAGSSVYGATLAPGAASFSNAVVNDVLGTATVNLVTTGQTSTSGNLTAGTHTGVEAVSALSGADAGNYTFAGTTGDYNVTKLALTGSIAAGSSIYGATLAPGAATITNAILGDVVTADTPTVSITNHTSTSGNLTAGTHLGIEVVGSALSGTDSGNYTFTGATGNYTVSPLAISVAAAGLNKVYDGTTSSSPTLTGSALILGDQIIISATAADFASKNAGIAQPITVSGISIGGADAANYALNNASATTTAMISTATLTVSGLAASNKTYDGNTTATLAGGSLVGVMAGDADFVTLTDAGSFASKNAGTGIAVTAADTLSGAGADNYVLVQPTGLLANITPATLTYNATPTTRTAGQTPTGLNGSLSGFVAADTQANDTIGTPAWTTTAGAGSLDGQYPIDGDGLTAANYVFIQATGNAGALTLQPAAAPPPIPVPPPVATVPALPPAALSAIAQLQATGLASFADARREALTVPLTLAAPPGAAGDGGTGAVDSGGSADGESMASASGQDTVTSDERPIIETHRTIDLMGASLRVVNGGVRLPN
jgi:hypothetical protein